MVPSVGEGSVGGRVAELVGPRAVGGSIGGCGVGVMVHPVG